MKKKNKTAENALRLPQTEQLFYLLVNRPDFLERAVELGYDNAVLVGAEGLSEEDVAAVRASGKAVAVRTYGDAKPFDGLEAAFYKAGVKYERLHYMQIPEDDDPDGIIEIDTPEIALRHFPDPEHAVEQLVMRGAILSTDYKNRCGHCREPLGPAEKYCRHCGTKRGEGECLPYYNDIRCAYGPPVSVKSKCSACGHVWITWDLGGDRSDFCPECGKPSVRLVNGRVHDWGDPPGVENPFDESDRPVLLSEEQIDALLKVRDRLPPEKERSTSEERMREAYREAGLPQPGDLHEACTEAESERWLLVESILESHGTDKEAFRDMACPNCGHRLHAAVEYSVRVPGSASAWEKRHTVANGKALVTWFGGYGDEGENGETVRPACLCLSCGRGFGKREDPDDQ